MLGRGALQKLQTSTPTNLALMGAVVYNISLATPSLTKSAVPAALRDP